MQGIIKTGDNKLRELTILLIGWFYTMLKVLFFVYFDYII